MLLLNTVSCNGTDLFWPFFWWLLGAFLLGLIIPWLLKMLFGGDSGGDWKDKYEGLDGKYNVLHSSNAKLKKDYEELKLSSGAMKMGASESTDTVDWKSKFDGLETKLKSLESDKLGLQTKYDNLLAKSTGEDTDWKAKYEALDGAFLALKADKESMESGASAFVAKSGDDVDWKAKHDALETKYEALSSDNESELSEAKPFVLKSSVGETDWKAKYEELLAEKDDSYGSGPNVDTGKRDNLTKVEGIGPKIQDLLNNGGIYTYAHLAEADKRYLRKILDDAGPAYKVHQPGTWPKQSKMADEGKWEELKKWQDELQGGV